MKKWLSEITNDIRNRWDSKVISRIIYNMMVEVLWLVLWLVERIQDIWLVESAVKLAFVSLKQLSTKQFQANLEESLYCLLRLERMKMAVGPKTLDQSERSEVCRILIETIILLLAGIF